MMIYDDICENLNVQNLGVSDFDVFPFHRMSMRGRCLDLSGKLPEVYPVEYGSKVPWAMDTADFWVSQLIALCRSAATASAEIKKHDFLASLEKPAEQVMPAWSEPESCRISPKQSQ